MRPVAERSTILVAPNLIVIARPPVADSGWQSLRIVLESLNFRIDESFIAPKARERASTFVTERPAVYRMLNETRGNESESTAVDIAVGMVLGGAIGYAVNWLFDAVLQDGSAHSAMSLSDLLRVGALSVLQARDRTIEPDRRSVMEETLDLAYGLFAYGLAVVYVDGYKCTDATAADRRASQLVNGRAVFVREIRALPVERRLKAKRFALALERATAADRVPDPTICRAGVEETRRAVARSWAANLPLGAPELEQRGRRGADGTLYVVVPAAPERPDMYRRSSEFPEAQARGRQTAVRVVDYLFQTADTPPAPGTPPRPQAQAQGRPNVGTPASNARRAATAWRAPATSALMPAARRARQA